MEYVLSNKNKKFKIFDGYTFRVEKTIENTMYLRCTEHHCKSRMIIKSESITKGPSDHSHVADASKLHARIVVEKMKNEAIHSQQLPQQIISATQIPAGVVGAMPSVSSIKNTLRRIRKRNDCVPTDPKSLFDLDIPEQFKKTKNGAQFLLHDSGPSNNRIIIFSTHDNLDIMDNYSDWFADGTFKTSPLIFSQVYTIHVLIKENIIIPTIYALLPNKTEETYIRLLTTLKEIKPNLNPKSIMTDFERSAINAFKYVFPNIKQNGCHFHFAQSIWRHIQQIQGLSTKYKLDPNFALHIRMISALAFVPPNNVILAFEELLDSPFFCENEEFLNPLTNYFEDTWIGRRGRKNVRKSPCFDKMLWNCYEISKRQGAKTNNSIEGWHRGFSSLLGTIFYLLINLIN